MNKGWIKLHRKLLNWEWINDVNTFAVFMHCILRANFATKSYKGTIIKRGSFVVGRDVFARDIGISVQSLRTSLKRLKSTSEITSESTNQGTVITVVNYDLYQADTCEPTSDTTNHLTNQQPVTNQQLTTTKKLKKEKKEKKIATENKKEISEDDKKEIANRYNVPIEFVESKLEDLYNYIESTGKRYNDYPATLRNWVKRDRDTLRFRQIQNKPHTVKIN